jgi:hypothetical protein
MKFGQEFYYYGEYVTYCAEIENGSQYANDFCIVKDQEGVLSVARKAEMKPKEESYTYIRAQERAAEIEAITAKAQENLDKVAEKIVDKALADLSFRIKMNVVMGKGGDGTAGLVIAKELEKMVKDSTPEQLKKKGIFD